MSVTISTVNDGLGSVTLAQGVVTDDQVREAHTRHFTQPPEGFARYLYSLADWTGVTDLDVTADTVRYIANLGVEAARANHQAIVAIAAASRLLFGFSRMFEALAAESGWEIRTFDTREEAEAWLRRRLKEKFEVELDSLG